MLVRTLWFWYAHMQGTNHMVVTMYYMNKYTAGKAGHPTVLAKNSPKIDKQTGNQKRHDGNFDF